MIRHPRRSTPAVVVALVLLALCVGVIVAVVQALTGRTPFLSLHQILVLTSSQHWNSAATVVVAIVLAVLGLLLLLAALRPGAPTVLPLQRLVDASGGQGAVAGVRRQTLTKDLATTAGSVPGVTSAHVSAGRQRVTATVQVAASDPVSVPGTVRERLEQRLAAIGPAARTSVRVRARTDQNT